MVDAELFEKIEYIAREVRKNPYPFGGIQLVCCGDFFQLPPVSRTNSATYAITTVLRRSPFTDSPSSRRSGRKQYNATSSSLQFTDRCAL